MTPTGNLRIVFDNVTVQVELHFCGMERRAITEVSLSMMENFPLPFSRTHHSVKFESARAPVGLSMMENFPLASYKDRHLLKAEFARTLTSKSMMEIFPLV
jgi:hypothetical protein